MITVELLKKVALLPLFLFSLDSNSALITADLYHSGDGLVTHDDVSGLNWIDLTVTRDLSYNEVITELGLGGALQGWRYATYEEASNLYSQFGFTVDVSGNDLPTEAFVDAVHLMNSFLGDLYADYESPNIVSGSQAIIGEPGQYYPDTQSQIYAFYQKYQDRNDQDQYVLYQMLGGNNWTEKWRSQPMKGSLLVAIPLPASAPLFLTAIAALLIINRKKA